MLIVGMFQFLKPNWVLNTDILNTENNSEYNLEILILKAILFPAKINIFEVSTMESGLLSRKTKI